MGFIGHLIRLFIGNIIALGVSDYFLTGFTVEGGITGFVTVAIFLTLITFFIRPVLRFIFTPLIIITLGLFSLILNAIILYALDFFSLNLIIDGLSSLIYGTLIITAITTAIHFSAKHSSKH